MEKIRVSAKTLDEAITKAQIQLNITYDNMKYNVIAEGSKGLFGIGAKPWIIEASVKEEASDFSDITTEIKNLSSAPLKETPKPVDVKEASEKKPQAEGQKQEKKPETKQRTDKKAVEKKAERSESEKQPKPEKKNRYERSERPVRQERPAQVQNEPVKPERPERERKPVSPEDAQRAEQSAKAFIQSVLGKMGMDVQAETVFDHEENELSLTLSGADMGILIGKRGQTLDSLQYLTSLVVNRDSKDEYIRVKLDTENYRARREATLRNLARNIAYKVKRTRKTVSLEPMNPYERRIIHSALQNDKYVTTKSEGEEPFRHVVIMLKKH